MLVLDARPEGVGGLKLEAREFKAESKYVGKT
jgi:hypothetical protein